MLALPGVNSTAVGTASLRLSSDGTQAILSYTVNGISGGHVDHIYSDPYLNAPSTLCMISLSITRNPTARTSGPSLPLRRFTRRHPGNHHENKCYIIIASSVNPGGEIAGHFHRPTARRLSLPRQRRPRGLMIHTNQNAAVRFLTQATFGASSNDIAAVQSLGYTNWIVNQLSCRRCNLCRWSTPI